MHNKDDDDFNFNVAPLPTRVDSDDEEPSNKQKQSKYIQQPNSYNMQPNLSMDHTKTRSYTVPTQDSYNFNFAGPQPTSFNYNNPSFQHSYTPVYQPGMSQPYPNQPLNYGMNLPPPNPPTSSRYDHPFSQSYNLPSENTPDIPLNYQNTQSAFRYQQASKIPKGYINNCYIDFQKYDINRNGRLSYNEVIMAIQEISRRFNAIPPTNENILFACTSNDSNANGLLSFEEFKRVLHKFSE